MKKEEPEYLIYLKEVEKILSEKENFNSNYFKILTKPEKSLAVSIPVKMDSGLVEVFEGFRVQYSGARGPFKGGLRYHPLVNLKEVQSLAFWMSVKCAVADIPYGGGKGGIKVDLMALSQGELERLTRGYMRAVATDIGVHKDIPAPDVYTNAQIMAWLVDEYSKMKGENVLGIVTGKPLELGGSLGRDTATAQGGSYVLERVLEKLKKKNRVSIAVNGFGNAGANFAQIAAKAGYKVVAVSDSKGGVYKKEGLDIEMVADHKIKTGSVVDFEGAKNITNEELLGLEVEVLVPAALENFVTKNNWKEVRAEVILELANGPVDKKASQELFKKGVLIIPDVLANSGGVVVSYFEWVQNLQNYYWSLNEVQTKLKQKMEEATDKILDFQNRNGLDMRTSAYVLAVKKIVKAIEIKGI